MSNVEKALEFKALGNEAFKNKQYQEAIKYFNQAIECNSNDHVLFSNRSGSYLNSGNYQKALEDAETCVKYIVFYLGLTQHGDEDTKGKELHCFT